MSTERQTINIPATKDQPFAEPDYFIDNRSKMALRELQQGDLLQLTIDHFEGEIYFVALNRQIAPDSLAQFFESPTPLKFAFYRHPGSDAVVLIWTRFPATSSTKKMHTQNRARRDLAWYAKKEGIEKVKTLQVLSRKEMNIERLQEAIDFSVA
ncbi:Ff.00g067140.m01.CDS01 [Fusarium sp. VM40]|nr:Ff.00g067140.m01.CDS01 [Fusarium sp. VM40]